MSDQARAEEQLLAELAALRRRVAELEALEVKRRQTEEALRLERDLVARIMETSPLGVVVVNKEGQITFANRHAEQKLGLTRSELTQRTYNAPQWRITAYNGSPFPDEHLPFPRVIASGEPVFDVRHAIELVDGRRVLLSINAAPLFDESAQISGMVATIEDVTSRIRAEEALRRSEATLRSTLRAAPVGIGLVVNRVFQWTNDTLHRMVGYSAGELEGQSARMLYESGEEFERVGREKYAEIAEKGTGTIETRFRCKDGSVILTAVVITGYATLDRTIEALHAGARGFLLKPFGFEELIAEVRAALAQRQKEEERLSLQAQLPILEISQALMTGGSVDVLAVNLLETVARQLDAKCALLLLHSAETDDLYVASALGLPEGFAAQGSLPVDQEIARLGRSASGPTLVNVQSLPDLEPTWQQLLAAMGLSSVQLVPLRTAEQNIGILCLGRGVPFTASELRLLAIVGRQIAIALDNARLYAAEQQRAVALTRALDQQRELDRLKNEFIQNVSHELRTPYASS